MHVTTLLLSTVFTLWTAAASPSQDGLIAALVDDAKTRSRTLVVIDPKTGERRTLAGKILHAFDAFDSQQLRWAPTGEAVFVNGRRGVRGHPNEGTHPTIVHLSGEAEPYEKRSAQHVTPSPDGKRVTWVRGRELVVHDVARYETRTLVKGTGRDWFSAFRGAVSWSADGATIYYTLGSRVRAVPANGGESKVVTGGHLHAVVPGGLVVSERIGSDFYDPRALRFFDTATGKARDLDEGAARRPLVSVSRDGKRLAFLLRGEGDTFHKRVAVVDLASGKRLATVEGSWPALSPDGSRVVVERGGKLIVHAMATGKERDLGPGRKPQWGPAKEK